MPCLFHRFEGIFRINLVNTLIKNPLFLAVFPIVVCRKNEQDDAETVRHGGENENPDMAVDRLERSEQPQHADRIPVYILDGHARRHNTLVCAGIAAVVDARRPRVQRSEKVACGRGAVLPDGIADARIQALAFRGQDLQLHQVLVMEIVGGPGIGEIGIVVLLQVQVVVENHLFRLLRQIVLNRLVIIGEDNGADRKLKPDQDQYDYAEYTGNPAHGDSGQPFLHAGIPLFGFAVHRTIPPSIYSQNPRVWLCISVPTAYPLSSCAVGAYLRRPSFPRCCCRRPRPC